jgi:hypothetical protein
MLFTADRQFATIRAAIDFVTANTTAKAETNPAKSSKISFDRGFRPIP